MARVFVSALAGADVVVFSHDHCPPHVTIRHRPEGWLAREQFSFVTDNVILWDVEPDKNAPRRSDLNLLMDEVQNELEASRRLWWFNQGTACLDNRWVEVTKMEASPLILLPKKRSGARQIQTAEYVSSARELILRFHDGSALRVAAGSGGER